MDLWTDAVCRVVLHTISTTFDIWGVLDISFILHIFNNFVFGTITSFSVVLESSTGRLIRLDTLKKYSRTELALLQFMDLQPSVIWLLFWLITFGTITVFLFKPWYWNLESAKTKCKSYTFPFKRSSFYVSTFLRNLVAEMWSLIRFLYRCAGTRAPNVYIVNTGFLFPFQNISEPKWVFEMFKM